MNLQQICQPLIDYVSEIYHTAHHGGNLEMQSVKFNIERFFDKMNDTSLHNAELAGELDKIKLPLIFFVDYMIKEGPFTFKDTWQEMARNYNELSGDEKFFDILDENLNDPSNSATQRLGVLYQCMGAGFNGCYVNDPEYVERKMRVCALRIGINSDIAEQDRITSDCYNSILNEKVFRDPVKHIRHIFYLVIAFMLLIFFINYLVYESLIEPLNRQLDRCLMSEFINEEQNSFMRRALHYVTGKTQSTTIGNQTNNQSTSSKPKSESESDTPKKTDDKPKTLENDSSPAKASSASAK